VPIDGSSPRFEGKFRFGIFEFDARTLELKKNGRLVAIRPQPLKLLALLVARPGELIARRDIQRVLWTDGTFVDFEQGVNHSIRELRSVLGDDAESPTFIQTLPRRGYRFVAAVQPVPPEQVQAAGEAAGHSELAQDVVTPVPAATPARWSWRPVAITSLVLVALALVVSLALRSTASPVTTGGTVLGVAPFSVSGSAHLDGVGLANAIASRLGGQQVLPVRRLTADAQSQDRRSATHIVTGEVTQTGNDLIVVVRLDDVSGSRTLWSERIHMRSDELFSVENVVAERVVAAFRLRLAAAEQDRLRRRYTSNSAAYEGYLHGRAALVEYTPDGTKRAISAFEDALDRDPQYALARAGLAMASADMYLRFAPASEVDQWGERAEIEARAALGLDSDLAEAHLARAAVARKREFDWNATIEASRRALVLNPNLDQAHLFIAAAYYHLGYMDQALIEMENGRRLHGPDVVEPRRIEALVALFSGRFAPAAVHLAEVSRLSSQAIGDTYLALAHYYSGSTDKARTMLESLANSRSASTSARASMALAGVLAAQGDAAAARLLVERVLAGSYRDHHVAFGAGAAFAQLGDTPRAIQWLKIAADTGFPCLPFFEHDPLLEPLRRHPEFSALLDYVRKQRDSSLSSVNQ
jgi:DNA-binding winged helix-turn-helix (wHTH) protein/tetratricopeptide (TPR) repeat protein